MNELNFESCDHMTYNHSKQNYTITKMSNLTYSQKREVEGIVDDRLNKNVFWDSIKNLIDKMYLEQQVREKAQSVVPGVCKQWVDGNLRVETESVANNYMRNNFQRFFRQEVSENKEVNGFISTHLDSVAQRVKTTADESVRKIVATDSNMNPIFQSHLQILSDRNKAQLDEQAKAIREGRDALDKAVRTNTDLHRRIESLERSHSTMTTISVLSFAGVMGLGLNLFLSKM